MSAGNAVSFVQARLDDLPQRLLWKICFSLFTPGSDSKFAPRYDDTVQRLTWKIVSLLFTAGQDPKFQPRLDDTWQRLLWKWASILFAAGTFDSHFAPRLDDTAQMLLKKIASLVQVDGWESLGCSPITQQRLLWLIANAYYGGVQPVVPPVAPPCTLPTAPVDLGVSPGDSQNTLNWPAGVGAMGYNIKRALVTGGPYTVIGTSAASPYVDHTAVNGTQYFYVVSSTNDCGESAGNSLESHGTPHVPVPVSVTVPVIAGTAQVGQTVSGTNGTWTNSPTGYAYRWLANGVAIGGATANTFLLTATQVGTVITFEVTASNAGGNSSPATSAATSAVLPLAPAGVTNLTAVYAANTATQINLAWTDNATNETEYRIYQSIDGGAYSLIATIAANSVSYNDATPTASHVFTYKVAPANAGGETLSGAITPTVASFTATTTGAAVLTIAALTVSAAMIVDWGDGNTNSYTGAGARTHNYAGAGTWTCKFLSPLLVTVLTLTDNKITLNSAQIAPILNVTSFIIQSTKAGTFNSSDVSAWRPDTFGMVILSAGYAGTFNSSDVGAWRPSSFSLYQLPAGYAGTFNFSDVSAWNPTVTFQIGSTPVGFSVIFNNSNVSAWRPVAFYLRDLSTITSTIAAGGFAAWTTTTTFNMVGTGLSGAKVDQVLADLYTAFATRTVAGGTITLNGGGNSAPSGIYQSACPPTSGKETAYDLINDLCLINPTKTWSTVTTN